MTTKKVKKEPYDPNDIMTVLTDDLIKTTTVKERLLKKDKKRYKTIHPDYLKQILKRLLEAEKIDGGMNVEAGMYLWKKKENKDWENLER